MQLAGDAAGPQGQGEAPRELVGRDAPQALEQCLQRCLSRHGLSQEVRLQDLLREEHVHLNVSLTRLSSQVAQCAAAAEATNLDQLAAKVDRLVDIVEGRQGAASDNLLQQVGPSIGVLLEEKVAPLAVQLERVRMDLSARPAPQQQGAVRAAPRLARQSIQDQGTQTEASEPPSSPEGARRTSPAARASAARSTMTQVLDSMPDDVGEMVHVQRDKDSWRSLGKMSRDFYHENVQHIHDQRLKAHASWLRIAVQSFAFEMFFATVIVAHLIYMVVDTDRSFGTRGTGSTAVFEACFLALYIAELVLKLSVDGWHFFHGPGWKSNLFDLFLVVSGSVDVVALFATDGDLFNSMALKAIRVFRLQKVLRIHRVVGMASDAQMVLQGLAACIGVLVGAGFLVFVYFLVFGIFFSQAVSTHIAESGGEVQGEVLEFYVTNFGSVFRTMFTLYQCVSGGQVWTFTWAALGPVWPGEALSQIFVVFHFVYLVLMVNVVSSVYVQKVLLYSLDQTQCAKLQMERRDREDARLILEDCDRNFGEGDTLNYKELLRLLLLPEVRGLFDARGIKLEDTRALHRTLAEKPAGLEAPQEWELNVKRREFFRLCMRLNREISTVEFAKSISAVRHFESDQLEHNRHVEASLDKLRKQLDHLNHALHTHFRQ